MLEDPEKASQENGIEDMEVHGAIEGILHAAAEQGPGSDQNRELGNAHRTMVATPSRKRSAVWMHYQKADDEKKALCLLCKENIQHQSTSNLLRHLQKKHPSHFSQLEMHSFQRASRHKTCHANIPPASTHGTPKTRQFEAGLCRIISYCILLVNVCSFFADDLSIGALLMICLLLKICCLYIWI